MDIKLRQYADCSRKGIPFSSLPPPAKRIRTDEESEAWQPIVRLEEDGDEEEEEEEKEEAEADKKEQSSNVKGVVKDENTPDVSAGGKGATLGASEKEVKKEGTEEAIDKGRGASTVLKTEVKDEVRPRRRRRKQSCLSHTLMRPFLNHSFLSVFLRSLRICGDCGGEHGRGHGDAGREGGAWRRC